MATATIVTTTTTRPPTNRERRHARELARLERAAALYEPPAQPGHSDDYRWYRRYLLDEYLAYTG